MVHTGKPSRGCDNCRKRHIKCDEAKPECSNCLKKQLACPGYRSQFDVAWRDQNAVAERGVRRRKNALKDTSRSQVPAENPSMALFPSVPKVLTPKYEDYAISFFMSAYVLLPRDPEFRRVSIDFLYPVWVQNEFSAVLGPAVAAVGSCLLEAWSFLQSDAPLSFSRAQYLKAITALRKKLYDDNAISDDILMAVLLLDMYDSVRSFLTSQPNNGPHISGIAALMENGHLPSLTSKVSQSVLLAARSTAIGRSLSNKTPVPPILLACSPAEPNPSKTIGLLLDDINIEVASVQSAVAQMKSAQEIEPSSVSSLLAYALSVDQQLLEWEGSAPVSWLPIRVSGSDCIPFSVRNAGLYQDHCDLYENIWSAFTWNGYSCSRIRVQMAIYACTERLSASCEYSTSAIDLAIVQELADNICATVPYCLGDRMSVARLDDKSANYPHKKGQLIPEDHHAAAAAQGGWFVAQRLAELFALDIPLRPGQRQWIGQQLQRVQKIYAIHSKA
ncbi:MAG: hypothetical protein M1820_000264 [Bogoriella megaspora]|nr:MAG: hypothetical protein M1820_000264 [Bogoriella megaspora]